MLKSTLQVLLSKLTPFIIIFLYLTFSNMIFLTLGWWFNETTEIFLEQFVVIIARALVLSVGLTIIGTIAFVFLLLGPTLHGVPLALDLSIVSKIDREDITYPGKLTLAFFLLLMILSLFGYLEGLTLGEAFLEAILLILPFTLSGMLTALGIVLTTGIILLSIKFVQTHLS